MTSFWEFLKARITKKGTPQDFTEFYTFRHNVLESIVNFRTERRLWIIIFFLKNNIAILWWTIVVLGMKQLSDGDNIRWSSFPGSFYREKDRECLHWRLYAGGALIKVADGQVQLY